MFYIYTHSCLIYWGGGFSLGVIEFDWCCFLFVCISGWAISRRTDEYLWNFRVSLFHVQERDAGEYTCVTPRGHANSVVIIVKSQLTLNDFWKISTQRLCHSFRFSIFVVFMSTVWLRRFSKEELHACRLIKQRVALLLLLFFLMRTFYLLAQRSNVRRFRGQRRRCGPSSTAPTPARAFASRAPTATSCRARPTSPASPRVPLN